MKEWYAGMVILLTKHSSLNEIVLFTWITSAKINLRDLVWRIIQELASNDDSCEYKSFNNSVLSLLWRRHHCNIGLAVLEELPSSWSVEMPSSVNKSIYPSLLQTPITPVGPMRRMSRCCISALWGCEWFLYYAMNLALGLGSFLFFSFLPLSKFCCTILINTIL